ncbi:uncharacterized protein LOC125683252 [Ostrea edulis]|uniref:uncharacterized protein LOC125683252 n=1 Tax=Ostrea edulis TaxID=37623 RepID=UPI0024AF37F5|nr:uncharacterized protein LOC125683252 [Ostrea edulis]
MAPQAILMLMLSYHLQWDICAAERNMCGNPDGTLKCCADYYLLNGSCKECFGAYGEDCSTPCELNTYGYRCRRTCDCNENQVCDRYIGCMDRECVKFFGKDYRMDWSTEYYEKSCKERCNCNETETYNQLVKCMEDDDRPALHNVTVNKEECTSIKQLLAGMIILYIFSFTLCFTLYRFRSRRQGMYDVQRVMDTSTDRQRRSQKIQMIHFKSLTEKCEDVKKIMFKKEFEKQMTHKYSRIIFPKFTSVDIPADQYSTAIIRNPHVLEDGESESSTDTSDGGDMQERLRHPSTDQRSAGNSRPYSVARNEWNC